MSKGLTFNDSERDRKIVKNIEQYQHRNEIPNFVEAVRRLCETALKIEEITNKKEL
ncbi:MAG: hypothetical protein K2J40_01775 [Ruminococcus sp.]|nr:hypothetical protein [Ruminococcus sp.]